MKTCCGLTACFVRTCPVCLALFHAVISNRDRAVDFRGLGVAHIYIFNYFLSFFILFYFLYISFSVHFM